MAVPHRFSSPKNAFNGGTPTGTLPTLEACPAVKRLCSKIVQGRWRIAFSAPSISSIPFLVRVGIVAVFYGHNGSEAGDMASKLLLEYFDLHVHFLVSASYSAMLENAASRTTRL
ncbi:hypothetical protein C1H46_005555 [Malus baccata]|uniref:Uncharacterized protein n=1 Tax=Malus baccata TaxID=106549 RepID=A0A540NCR8_MALBA|nr:hypothetical protein C1H46_005555 [Malus baccata]